MNGRELYMQVNDFSIQDRSGVYNIIDQLADMIEGGYDFETWADDYISNNPNPEYRCIGANQYEYIEGGE